LIPSQRIAGTQGLGTSEAGPSFSVIDVVVLFNQRFLLQLPSAQPIAGEVIQKRRYSQKQYALLANEIRARRNQH